MAKQTPLVRRPRDLKPITAPDGATVTELFNRYIPGSSEGVSVAVGQVDPGVQAKKHYHLISGEIFYVLSGKVRVHVGRSFHTLSTGDAIFIPNRTEHGLENDSQEKPAQVLCICSPPFLDKDFYEVD